MKAYLKFSVTELEAKLEGHYLDRQIEAILSLLADQKFAVTTLCMLEHKGIVEIFREPGPPEDKLVAYLK